MHVALLGRHQYELSGTVMVWLNHDNNEIWKQTT